MLALVLLSLIITIWRLDWVAYITVSHVLGLV